MLHANWHTVLTWVVFLFGCGVYMLKRAYFLVKGPNPVANTYKEFIIVCWIPLFVRLVEDSIIFGIVFIPDALAKLLGYLGWQSWEAALLLVTQYSIFALAFGLFSDAILDILVTKVPGLKDWQPQMPPPLPKPDELFKKLESNKNA